MEGYAFIGAGNMAYAIIGGMKNADITVYDKIEKQYEKFSDNVKRAASVVEAVNNCKYIVLSVKPQNFREVLAEIRESGVQLDGKVFISIAAGVKISSIIEGLGWDVPVIRTMPNTPLLIGEGVTALSRNSTVRDEDFEQVCRMFSAIGKTFVLPEEKMNAVIAATASAPAYIYYIIDAIAREARDEGIDSESLLEMVCAMVKGSADMVMSSDKTPEQLISAVTSPNGTTERAMKVFEENGLDRIIADAMKACTKRAQELSDEL